MPSFVFAYHHIFCILAVPFFLPMFISAEPPNSEKPWNGKWGILSAMNSICNMPHMFSISGQTMLVQVHLGSIHVQYLIQLEIQWAKLLSYLS